MRFIAVVAVIEAAVIVTSGLDTLRRSPAERRPWAALWLWWHLAPAWLLWLALVTTLMAAADRWARRSYEQHEHHRNRRILLAGDDRWPVDGSAVSDGTKQAC